MHYRTLITVVDFPDLGGAPDWVVIDCRFNLSDKNWGEAGYREGHVPGAHYAHLERDLSGPVKPDTGRHPLPHWRDFAELLGQWGVHPDSQVIVYDQDNGAYAARLWWMLRAVGHTQVAVLEGGWSAWLAAGGPVSTSTPTLEARNFRLSPGSGWVTSAELQNCMGKGDCLLVDARSSERFAGEREPVDLVAGHVPGAVNRPYTDNLRSDGSFHPIKILRDQWTAILEERDPAVVVHMCGSGVTACHNMLAMEVADLTGSRLYVGSWSEWIRADDRPVATGSS